MAPMGERVAQPHRTASRRNLLNQVPVVAVERIFGNVVERRRFPDGDFCVLDRAQVGAPAMVGEHHLKRARTF